MCITYMCRACTERNEEKNRRGKKREGLNDEYFANIIGVFNLFLNSILKYSRCKNHSINFIMPLIAIEKYFQHYRYIIVIEKTLYVK